MLLFLIKFNRNFAGASAGVSSAVLNSKARGLMRFKAMRRLRRSLYKKWIRLRTFFAARYTAPSHFPESFVAGSRGEQSKLLLSFCKTAQAISLAEERTMSSLLAVTVRIGAVLYNNTDFEVARLLRSIEFSELPPGVTVSVALLNNGQAQAAPACGDICINFQQSSQNLGFGPAHNVLMREAFDAGCDVYIGVNPDGFFEQEAIAAMLRLHVQKGQRALIEAVQFPEEHPKIYHPQTLDTNWISGACFLYPREVWGELGGFDENFFFYCEDVDLSWRARLSGIATLTCPEALFYHDTIDRPTDTVRRRHMLVAGRYLAYKWRSDRFLWFTESCLRDLGVQRRAMPKLGPDSLRMPHNMEPTASFAQRFHFAETRW